MSFWPPPPSSSSSPSPPRPGSAQFSRAAQEDRHDAYQQQQAVFAASQSRSGTPAVSGVQFDQGAYEWQQQQYHPHHHEQHLMVDPRAMAIASLDPLPIQSNAHSSHVQAPVSLEDEIFEARMLQEALRDCDLLPPAHSESSYPDAAKHHDHHHHHHHHHHHSSNFSQHSPSFQGQQVQFPPQFTTAMITPTNMTMTYRNPSIHVVSPVENLRNLHLQQAISQSPSPVSSTSSSTRSPVMRLSEQAAGATTPLAKKRVQTARICHIEGCTRGIRSRGLCKAHGGGRRCTTPGCTTSDQGGGHCVLHGGGRRCRVDGCMKSAQWRGVCKLHGGARRCRYGHCTKNGQVKQGYCRLHYNLLTAQQLQQKLHSSESSSHERGSDGDTKDEMKQVGATQSP